MALLSIAIQARGVEAISFTGSQSGILTNDRHFDARIIEVRPHRIEDELARGQDRHRRRLPGHELQARDHDARSRRLGHDGGRARGGARRRALRDLQRRRRRLLGRSARRARRAAPARARSTRCCRRWPRPARRSLNAQAVEWARRAGIAIYARATFDAVVGDARARRWCASRRSRARRSAPARSSPRATSCSRALADGAQARRPAPASRRRRRRASRTSRPGTRGGVVRHPAPQRARLGAARSDGSPRRCRASTLTEGVAVVSVVGDGLAATPEPLARFVEALRGAGDRHEVPVTATPLRLGAVVESSRAEAAQRALHGAFVGDA